MVINAVYHVKSGVYWFMSEVHSMNSSRQRTPKGAITSSRWKRTEIVLWLAKFLSDLRVAGSFYEAVELCEVRKKM